jgi:hypothetical protein
MAKPVEGKVAAAHFGCCVLCVVCSVFLLTSFTLTGREAKIGPAKMANFSVPTTEKAPQNAQNVKGCPKLQSSIDLGHPLTAYVLWTVVTVHL